MKIVLVALLFILSCSNENPVSIKPLGGNCFGSIKNKNGSPFSGAHVILISDQFNPLASDGSVVDSTVTDEYGCYFFNVNKTGIYNIFAAGGKKVSMRTSVLISTSAKIDLESEILTEPGNLCGTVHLQGTNNHKSAIILFIGTNMYTSPIDSTGTFSVANLAPGSYHIKCISSAPDYSPVDTNITVVSQETVQLPVIQIEKRKSFEVDTFSVNYNTALKMASLSWRVPFDTTSLSHFNLYVNRENNSAPFAIIKNNLESYQCDLLDILSDSIVLSLSIVDNSGIEGPEVKLPIFQKESSFRLVKTIQIPYVPVDTLSGIEVVGDISVHFDYQSYMYINKLRNIEKYDSNGTKIASFVLPQNEEGSFFGFREDVLKTDRHGNCYAILYADNKSRKLLHFNSNLELVHEVTISDSLTDEYTFFSFCVSPDGTITVVSTTNNNSSLVEFFDQNLNKINEMLISGNNLITPSIGTNEGIIAIVEDSIIYFDSQLNKKAIINDLNFLSPYYSPSMEKPLVFWPSLVNTFNSNGIFIYPQVEPVIFFNNKSKVIARFSSAGISSDTGSTIMNHCYIDDNGYFYVGKVKDENSRYIILKKYYSEVLDTKDKKN